MRKLSLQQVTEIAQGKLLTPESASTSIGGVSIDTRTLNSGELYVAIRGANHDGHKFLTQALAGGAAAALIEPSGVELLTEKLSASLPAIVVEDSHQALIDLAIAHRKEVTSKTTGITGSVGKTTVKEMTRHLLETSGATVHASAGNLNNLYGLPLSLLQMDSSAQYGVFELGISTVNEMSRLAPILKPLVGVITNVSETHVEALGSLEGVRREKLSLLENLQESGRAVVNGADKELTQAAKGLCDNVLTFAVADSKQFNTNGADIVASEVQLDSETGFVSFFFESQRVKLPVFGQEQVANALCAFAICQALGVKVEMAALESFSSAALALRGERQEIDGVNFIVDCYNANPTSMKAGLKTFALLQPKATGQKKIALIGDMLELGSLESQEHIALGGYIADLLKNSGSIDVIITVGQRARLSAESLMDSIDATSVTIHSVENAQEAGALLADMLRSGDMVYLKASRGIALEQALTKLKARSQA